MINEKEFRIGNYFKPTDGTAEPSIVTIDDLRAWDRGAGYGKPIPLTSEWLLKLGFNGDDYYYEKVLNSFIYPSEGNSYLHLSDEDGSRWSIYLSFKHSIEQSIPIFKYKVIFVHQLQNLYFALTGEELEMK